MLVEQKIIRTAADTLYPAVFGLFGDNGRTGDERMAICDRELPARITSYIGHSAEQMEQINRHLAAQLTKNQSVILWGAGQLAMKLLALPALAHTPVRALVDNNPILRGKTLAGAPIIGPRQIGPREVGPQGIAGTRDPIIIATLLHAEEISSQIRSLGLANPILSLLPHASLEARR